MTTKTRSEPVAADVAALLREGRDGLIKLHRARP